MKQYGTIIAPPPPELFHSGEAMMQYVSLLEQNSIVSKTDCKGVIQFANNHFCEISGYSELELVGSPHNIVNSGTHSKEFFAELWQTISTGRIWTGEICNRAKDGRLYWVQSTIVPVFDDDSGDIAQYISIRFDITEKKRFDEQLFQMQRLESIGRMTAGVAHDFNNMLGSILGYSEIIHIISDELPEGNTKEEIQASLFQITKAGWRAANLIEKMLTYCRHDAVPIQDLPSFNVVNLLNDVLAMFRGMTPSSVILETHFIDTVFIHVDETEFHQIVMNLCVNASDAMQNKGKIRLTTEISHLSNHKCDVCLEKIEGEFIEITISDTGEGIPKERISKIFDPFFTTKEVCKGTGLGLSVVSGIMHKLGGHIVVNSELGKGTTFRLFFPNEL